MLCIQYPRICLPFPSLGSRRISTDKCSKYNPSLITRDYKTIVYDKIDISLYVGTVTNIAYYFISITKESSDKYACFLSLFSLFATLLYTRPQCTSRI